MDKRLVKVEWLDAADPDDPKPWYTDDEVDAFSASEVMITSVGYVKSETKQYLTLCADYTPNDDGSFTWSRITKIPHSMIQKIEGLKETE